MRHTVELDPENQVAVIRYHGAVDINETPQLLDRVTNDPAWTPQYSRIMVYDDALLGDVNDAALNRVLDGLAKRVRDAYGETPNFSVHVCTDPMKIPIVRYWLAMARTRKYPAPGELFSSLEDAIAWINDRR